MDYKIQRLTGQGSAAVYRNIKGAGNAAQVIVRTGELSCTECCYQRDVRLFRCEELTRATTSTRCRAATSCAS